jgi:hypothetical protein
MYHDRYPEIMSRIAELHREAELARGRTPQSDEPYARVVATERAPTDVGVVQPAECPECPSGATPARAA